MALGWRRPYLRYREFFLNISALYKKRSDLRAFLEITLSLTTILMFLIFAIKPTVVTIIDLMQQIREKQSTLSGLTEKVSALKKANDLLTQNRKFIPNIDISVPTLPNPDTLSGQIFGIATKNSVEILGVSINQLSLVGVDTTKSLSGLKPLPGKAKEIRFSVSVKGPFSNLNTFIKDFENSRIANKIDALTITSSTTDKGLVIVAIISGRVPYVGK